jgi:polyhydroxybutyrate depolymerase
MLVVVVLASVACTRRDREAAPPTTPSTASTTAPATAPGSAPVTGSSAPAAGPSETVAIHPAVDPVGKVVDGTLTTPDGRTRTYHLYVPASLPKDQPAPLLVALHGGAGWGEQFEKNSGFDGLAEANQFLVVYPDGISQPPTPEGRVWNGGDCCGTAQRQDVDDVGFISALIDQLEGQYDIDHARVAAAGHSNGGILAYRLACELADKIVAIGVQSATLGVPSCHPSQPVSVVHIHGTADQNIPINGGTGDRSLSQTDFPPPIDGVHTLAAANGCPADPSESVNGDITTDVWSPCQGSTAVEFVKVNGAGHAWMGHTASKLAGALVGPPYMGLDSSAVIWSFLAAHPRR